MLSTTGSAFLGLTIGCARCHDHKYDPISTADYYQMLSTFTTTVRSIIDLDVEPERTRELKRKWEGEHAPLAAEVHNYEESLKHKFDSWLASGAAEEIPASWILLEVTNLTSKAGATLRRSRTLVLAEGKNGDNDEYTFVGSTTVNQITGLRLDALADPSLKKGGPGRADNGNIGLSRIRVFVAPSSATGTQEVKIVKAQADFEQNNGNLSIAAALDDQPNSGWAVDPQFGLDHRAVFTFAEALNLADGATFTVKLAFQLNAKHNIRRPRLAVTSEVEPRLDGETLPARVVKLLQK
jgi:hypothetical protein